jgi:Cu2+-exporting ATPase
MPLLSPVCGACSIAAPAKSRASRAAPIGWPGIFVLVLLAIVATVAAVWYGIDPARVFTVTLAMLVVSCPCALSLATPAALTVASGVLHAQGVLVTHGDAIEHLAQATDYVFDKTGTLTSGRMRLVGVIPLGAVAAEHGAAQCLAWARALAADSAHPIARALMAGAQAELRAEAVRNIAGSGIEGVVQSMRMRLGKPQFVAELHAQTMPQELAFIADDVSMIALGRRARMESAADFRRSAASVCALTRACAAANGQACASAFRRPSRGCSERRPRTGDRARACGRDTRRQARVCPWLQREGAVVAMIGDGVNDAACLAAAQLSVAMGGGADLACATGDIVLLSERLDALLAAVTTARATLRVIKQNLGWAFAYNMVAVPLAACGYVTPLLAGAGMAASSMLVVANAIRLMRNEPQVARPAPAMFA